MNILRHGTDPTGQEPERVCEVTFWGNQEIIETFKVAHDGADVSFRFLDAEFLKIADQDDEIFLNEIKNITELNIQIQLVQGGIREDGKTVVDIIPEITEEGNSLYGIGDLISELVWTPRIDLFSAAGIEYFRGMERVIMRGVKITELDLSWNKNVTELFLFQNKTIKSLNLTNCPDLKIVDVLGEDGLENIDFSNNKKITRRFCYYMNNLLEIDPSGMPDLESMVILK